MKVVKKLFSVKLLFAVLLFTGTLLCVHRPVYVYAATAVEVAAVEYYDDNVVVFNNGNTKIYYATDSEAASNRWDVIDADPGIFTTIDISWMNAGIDNVLMIKGNLEDTKSRVVVNEQPTKLNISINYSNMDNLSSTDTIASLLNIMTTEGTAQNPITYDDLEWKKGEDGCWQSPYTLTVTQLKKFLVRGANIYFRIRAYDDCVTVTDTIGALVDFNQDRIDGISGGILHYEATGTFQTDYPDGTQGRRFSNEVKLKVIRQVAPMVYGIDGEKFTAALKYGKEYKVTVTYSDGSTGKSNWVKITDRSVKNVSLADLANSADNKKTDASGSDITYNGTTVAFPAMKIEVRNYATKTTAASKITETTLDAQRSLNKGIQAGQPDASVTQTKDDIYVYYYSDKYILLTIPQASSDLPYEYCIVKAGSVFNPAKTSWSMLTKNTGIKILANKAPEGSTLYVRQKEIKSKAETSTADAVSYKLASTYVSYTLKYPSAPVVTKDTLIYTKKGYTGALTITIQLNESGKVPFETSVKALKLGTAEIGFTSAISVSPTDSSISILTVTLDNNTLETMTNCTNRLLSIVFGNDTIDKSSVKVTIKNPASAGSLSLTAVAGTNTGYTKVSVVSAVGSGNSWVYEIGDAAVSGKYVEDVLQVGTGTAFTSGMEIAVSQAGKYITVYEIDSNRNIIKYKSIQITSSMIKS